MKSFADPVRNYLSAVERESSALPADRRQELLADLAEHIEVTRTERPEGTVGGILAELGDPRTIAATALAEAGTETPGPVFGFLFRVTGAVLLCTSVHWTAVQKTTGVLLTVVVPTTVIASWNVISGWAAGETQALLGNLGVLALMVGTAVWLWRTRRA